MKPNQHVSKGISQSRQLEISKNINQSFVTDNSKFQAFDPELNMAYSNKINEKIQLIENIQPDYVLVAMQMQATKNVINYSNKAIANIRSIRYYVEKAFPDDNYHLYEFGYTSLKKVLNSQPKLVLFLKTFILTLDKYKDDLIHKGLAPEIIEETKKLGKDLDKANITQEQSKRARFIATGTRIKSYDELWKLIGNVAKAGKIIFEAEPDSHRNYILDSTPKKKTLKVADEEINPAFMQGKVTAVDTHKIIEDAIVEILTTQLSAITDENGEFYIDEVFPGTYSIKITAIGYKELIKTDIKLISDNEDQEFAFELEKLSLDIV